MNSWGNKFDETREADLFSTLADCKTVFTTGSLVIIMVYVAETKI